MDIHDRRYEKCVFCKHELIYHYSTYTLDSKMFNPLRQGCSVTYIPEGETYVPDEKVTMTTKLLACPCRGFASVLKRDEIGNVYPVQ